MKKRKKALMALLAILVLFVSGCSGEQHIKLDKENPQMVNIWHYYSGAQQEAFDLLVEQYNQGEGKEEGIRVKAENYGSVGQLAEEVMNCATNQIGSGELPDIFLGYTDTVYQVNQEGLIVDLDQYFKEEELKEYVPAFIEEGRMGEDGKLKIFPIAKSTEIFMMNLTDWEPFAEETGASLEQLATMEGITRTAKAYFKWSGGKAFFGRDAFANYMISGAMQLGCELLRTENGKADFQIDDQVMQKLWDHYYIPSIYGYFASYGKFRSDDVKVGDLLAFVGSSTSASYFPQEVFLNDDESHTIDAVVMQVPAFEDGQNCSIQQGAGMAVIKSDTKREYAAVQFIKWFTQKEQNLEFCVQSGYLPVKAEALDEQVIRETIQNSSEVIDEKMQEALLISAETIRNQNPYTNLEFEGKAEVRKVLEYSIPDKLAEDLEWIENEMKNGRSREEAAKSLDTDENFQQWLKGFKTALEKTQAEEIT